MWKDYFFFEGVFSTFFFATMLRTMGIQVLKTLKLICGIS